MIDQIPSALYQNEIAMEVHGNDIRNDIQALYTINMSTAVQSPLVIYLVAIPPSTVVIEPNLP